MTLYSISIDGRHVARFEADSSLDAARQVAEKYDARGTAVLIECVSDALNQFDGEMRGIASTYPANSVTNAQRALIRGRLARIGFTVPPTMPLADTAEVYRRAAASEGTDPAHRPILARIAGLLEAVS